MKLRNNIAAFGWGISILFLVMCSAITYIIFRDGFSSLQIYPPDTPRFYQSWTLPVVLAVFWTFGLGAACYFAKKPSVQVEVRPDKSVAIIRRFPFRKEVQVFQATELSAAEVVEKEDSDGDPYFTVAVTHAGASSIIIAEGHVRQACEKVASHFNTDIGKITV